MTETNNTKKQFIIFLLMAYGVTYLMGILIWYGTTVSADLSAFGNAQMFYPAAGVMLAYLLTKWEDGMLPRWFYLCFLLITLLMILISVLAIVRPGQNMVLNGVEISMWAILSQYAVIGGSILCWITLLIAGKKEERFMDSDGSV